MKPYEVSVDKRNKKFVSKLSKKQARQVHEALIRLGNNPRPQDSRKLKTTNGYRVTVGEYRILYTIDDDEATIKVFLITNRNGLSY